MMNDKVIARVAALPAMDSPDLKALWHELYAEPAPAKKREYLIPRLAYRIQELAYGGLSESAQDRLAELVSTKESTTPASKRVKRPPIGTKLIREYRGVEHHVTVTREGFEYQGRTLKSLSHIAREITGTRWSGPLFFGLTGAAK